MVYNISLDVSLPVAASTTVPARTDDGLDPINMIWTGFAPAWWVAQNFKEWNPTLCSLMKTLNSREYDFTLETPDTRSQSPPCWGPRFHVRIWDMGEDPIFGRWSIGAVHHEYTQCNPFPVCHHVVDSWENAELLASSTFEDGNATLSTSKYVLSNAGLYQGVYNDGNATTIQLTTPETYPVTFTETGLPRGVSWSVELNGKSLFSNSTTISFAVVNGTYVFSIGSPSPYDASPSSGTLSVKGSRLDRIVTFTQKRYSIIFSAVGLPSGTQWSVALNGTTLMSRTETIVFNEPAGVYRFVAGNVAGFDTSPSSGLINVTQNENVSLNFKPTGNSSLIANLPVLSFSAIASIVAGAGVLFLLRKRIRRVPNNSATPPRSLPSRRLWFT